MSNKLSEIANPFDFANPVSRSDRFFGREREMSEVRYYLDFAATAERPINIALLGDRAAGKTSILNIIEIEAKQKGFCVVRIDLDEGDAAQPLAFFYKMFDAIFTQAVCDGAFGGLTGKTYESYLNVVSTGVVPEDPLFHPFMFPLQYALGVKASNLGVPISDTLFKRDLRLVAGEVKRSIVLLFDEANVLAQSRVLLEKIRNHCCPVN